MEIGVTGSGRLQRPDRLAGISEASNSIGGIGAVALIQLNIILWNCDKQKLKACTELSTRKLIIHVIAVGIPTILVSLFSTNVSAAYCC